MAKLIRRGASKQPLGRLRLYAGCPFSAGAFVYPLATTNAALGAGRPGLAFIGGTKKIGEVGQYVSLSGSPNDFIRLGADSRMQAETFSALMVVKFDALPPSGSVYTIFQSGALTDQSNGASDGSFQFRVDNSGSFQVIRDNQLAVYVGTEAALAAKKWAAISIAFKAGNPGTLSIAVNGRIVAQNTPSASGFKAGDFTLGTKDGSTTEKGAMDVALFAYWPRTQVGNEQTALTINPWQLFEGPSLPVFQTSAAVPVALAGSAAAVASAYGTLTSAIPLAGVAQAVATGAGALSTSIPLSGAATGRASAAGALSTAIPLAGAAVATVSATGALAGGGATLVGAAVASVKAAGTLSTTIPLAGAARAEASATGTLAGTATGLSGTVRVTASATGSLSTSIRLAAAAAAVASAYGALTSRITLGGAAVASAAATGALSVGKPSAPIEISKVDPARVVVFEGSGSRIVVFPGSGKRLRFDTMSAKKPTLVGTKWVVDRDPDEQSYYAADITDELLDRYTTLATGGDAIELIPQGVTQLEDHSVQVANVDGVDRTYIVVLLGGVEGDLPKDWFWCARVKCANGERFDKTTWFNRVDT